MPLNTGDPLVTVSKVTKRYGTGTALRGISLRVHAGEVLGVAGPNGSGKSTLGRIIVGFARPTSGDALIGGIDARSYRIAYGVGFLPEECPRVWGNALVRDLLLLRGDLDAAPGGADLLAMLGVTPLLHRRVATISKGQWRIVLSSYAMLGAPSAILLDEPDAGLDPAAMSRLRAGVKFAASLGSAVTVLSHHLDELALLSDRVMFVRQGAITGEYVSSATDAAGLRRAYVESME